MSAAQQQNDAKVGEEPEKTLLGPDSQKGLAGADDGPVEQKPWTFYALYISGFVISLYGFLFGLALMGDSFKALSGKGASDLMTSVSNPIAGLMVGIIVTVLLQSSSTTTSIVTAMVGASIVSVEDAIPIIMGANIGTSVTNTIIAHGQIQDQEQFKRAFAGATVHDMFNILCVVVMLPLEVITGAMGIPFLFSITEGMTSQLEDMEKSGGLGESPIKTIVSPISKAFLSPNKDIIKILSLGCVTCVPTPFLNESFVDVANRTDAMLYAAPTTEELAAKEWCEGIKIKKSKWASSFIGKYYKATNWMTAGSASKVCYTQEEHDAGDLKCEVVPCYDRATWDEKYTEGDLVKDGFLLDIFGSTGAAVVALIISLATLCLALYIIVYSLQKLILSSGGKGKVIRTTSKILDYPYLCILFGLALTICVQSSSITTSTLTPLVGLGVITLEQMLPLTLGANIGTTCTALIASFVSMKRDAIQIALCHLCFNLFGILIWFPIPFMRRVPIKAAEILGEKVIKYPWFGMFYIFYAFIFVPIIIYAISGLFDLGAAGIFFGTVFTVAIFVGAVGLIWKFDMVYDFARSKTEQFGLARKQSMAAAGGAQVAPAPVQVAPAPASNSPQGL